MAFFDLPNEIIQLIVDFLEYEDEINALARTNWTLHHRVNPLLYQYNVSHEQSSALPRAIIYGSTTAVQILLEAGAPADTCHPTEAWQPMALAAMHGQESIVRLLCEQGVDPSPRKGWANPLHYCYEYDPQGPGNPLSLAAQHGHEAIVRFLIGSLDGHDTIDFPASYDGKTPLALAAEAGHLSIVQLLVNRGAQVEAIDEDQSTPLALAVEEGRLEVVQFLLDQGAAANHRYRQGTVTPLCQAASLGHLKVVRCLLDRGVTVESHKDLMMLPLSRAVGNEHQEIVDLLLERVNYVHLATEPSERAVMLSVAAACGKLFLVRQLLESHDYDANARWTDQWAFSFQLHPTALCWAAARGHAEIVELLLAHGADMTHAAFSGRRLREYYPLVLAVSKGYERIVALLLAAGADPNYASGNLATNGGCVLALAIPFESIFHRLLEAGADPTAAASNGTSLVGQVVSSGRVSEVRMLLDRGVDLAQHTGGGANSKCTLLQLAVRGGPAVFQLLLQHGGYGTHLSPQQPNLKLVAFREAVSRGCVEMVQILHDRGIFPVQIPDSRDDYLACAAAAGSGLMEKSPYANPAAMVDFLLRHGADLNKQTFLGCTSLHWVTNRAQTAAARLLLDRGANPLLMDSNSTSSPLSAAAWYGHEEVFSLLLRVIDARDEPFKVVGPYIRQAEMWAREQGQDKFVKMLRQYYWRRRHPVHL